MSIRVNSRPFAFIRVHSRFKIFRQNTFSFFNVDLTPAIVYNYNTLGVSLKEITLKRAGY